MKAFRPGIIEGDLMGRARAEGVALVGGPHPLGPAMRCALLGTARQPGRAAGIVKEPVRELRGAAFRAPSRLQRSWRQQMQGGATQTMG
jgi:hypothetical protein